MLRGNTFLSLGYLGYWTEFSEVTFSSISITTRLSFARKELTAKEKETKQPGKNRFIIYVL